MARENGPKSALSGKLMGMKFMQRSNETTRLKELQDEQQRLEDEAHWVLPMAAVAGLGASASTSSEVEVVDSFVELDSASVPASGRRSFKNFNAEIERLARRNQGTQQDKELREEKQVQKAADVEMANQMQSIQSSSGGHKRKYPSVHDDDEGDQSAASSSSASAASAAGSSDAKPSGPSNKMQQTLANVRAQLKNKQKAKPIF